MTSGVALPFIDVRSQSFIVRAFSIVSAVVKVLLTTITKVSSGLSLVAIRKTHTHKTNQIGVSTSFAAKL